MGFPIFTLSLKAICANDIFEDWVVCRISRFVKGPFTTTIDFFPKLIDERKCPFNYRLPGLFPIRWFIWLLILDHHGEDNDQPSFNYRLSFKTQSIIMHSLLLWPSETTFFKLRNFSSSGIPYLERFIIFACVASPIRFIHHQLL